MLDIHTAFKSFVGILLILILAGVPILMIIRIYMYDKKELEDYNKKHKTNFKTSADLQNEKLKIKKAETAKKEKLLEKERLQEEERLAKEEKAAATEPSSSDIGARLKKLRQMYKDGILSKVEFEKAKNKLLK